MLTFKDFGGQDERRLKGKNGSNYFTTDPISSQIIKAEKFEFSVKIHKRDQMMIGVMKPGHKQEGSLGLDGYSWGVAFYTYETRTFQRLGDGNIAGHWTWREVISSFGLAKTGDTIRFLIDKKNKKIHAQNIGKNTLELMICEKNCEGFELPEKLQICCTRHGNEYQDVEIVDFKQHSPSTGERFELKSQTEELKRQISELQTDNDRLRGIVEKNDQKTEIDGQRRVTVEENTKKIILETEARKRENEELRRKIEELKTNHEEKIEQLRTLVEQNKKDNILGHKACKDGSCGEE